MQNQLQVQNLKNEIKQLENLFEISKSILSLSKGEFGRDSYTFRNNNYRTGYITEYLDYNKLSVKKLFIIYLVFVLAQL